MVSPLVLLATLPSPTQPSGLGPPSPALRERVPTPGSQSGGRRVRVLQPATFIPSA